MGVTTLYRWYDIDDRLLYVGITERGDQRFREHRKGSGWWAAAVRSTVEHFPTREDADEAETIAIQSERPLFNIAKQGTSLSPLRFDHLLDVGGVWRGMADLVRNIRGITYYVSGGRCCYRWWDQAPLEHEMSVRDIIRASGRSRSEMRVANNHLCGALRCEHPGQCLRPFSWVEEMYVWAIAIMGVGAGRSSLLLNPLVVTYLRGRVLDYDAAFALPPFPLPLCIDAATAAMGSSSYLMDDLNRSHTKEMFEDRLRGVQSVILDSMKSSGVPLECFTNQKARINV